MAAKMEPKSSPPSKGGISRLKVVFFFPLLPVGAIFGGVVDFFLCKRGGEARKQGFSANEKKAWRKIWCGFFFQCGCNGHGAFDILIYNEDEKSHMELVQWVMERIRKVKLCCSIKKSCIHASKIEFLGYHISAKRISM